MEEPFSIMLRRRTPHGVLVGVRLPKDGATGVEAALGRLHEDERRYALGLRGRERAQFLGGRLAVRAAVESQGGAVASPVLPDEHGAPCMPAGFSGSISHKRELAVALVDREEHGSLGVDLEEYRRPRVDIGPCVLAEEERAEVEAEAKEWHWLATLMRFSLKEAVYKALHRYVRRDVEFEEVLVHPGPWGDVEVSFRLRPGEGPFSVDARYEWSGGLLLSSARLRVAQGS